MDHLADQVLVWGAVGAAAGYFVFRWWRKRRLGKACGGDCCAPRTQPKL